MKTKLNFNMWIPTRILFGADELKNLHRQQMPGKKALLAISNGKSTRANGYLAATEEQLRLAGIESVVFDRIEANPLKSTVMAGAAAAREHGCDMIVALGGGSVMDAAKAIALMASNDGDLWDYVFGGTGKEQQAGHAPLPLIAITTTAGTGSEVDPWGVVTNEQTHEKIGVEAGFPVLAVVDPKLMLTVPPKFTAYQGFDALFHSVESYISKFANLASDMYALTAIEHIARNLPRAVANGDDLEARTRVAFGNTLSGVVMCLSATTSQHSMEHAMSAYHQDLPHGAGLIMLSRAYFSFFIDRHVCNERFVRMARAMGMEQAAQPGDFITALTRLQQACGVADLRMSDYGITPGELQQMTFNAFDTMPGLFESDRHRLSIDECTAIYRAAYKYPKKRHDHETTINSDNSHTYDTRHEHIRRTGRCRQFLQKQFGKHRESILFQPIQNESRRPALPAQGAGGRAKIPRRHRRAPDGRSQGTERRSVRHETGRMRVRHAGTRPLLLG